MYEDGIEDFKAYSIRKADFLACNSMPDGQIEPMYGLFCLRDIFRPTEGFALAWLDQFFV
jgi:hypothetical protein